MMQHSRMDQSGFENHKAHLNDNVNAKLPPWQLEGVAARDNLNVLPINADGAVVNNLNVGIKGPKDAVVLQEVSSLECRTDDGVIVSVSASPFWFA